MLWEKARFGAKSCSQERTDRETQLPACYAAFQTGSLRCIPDGFTTLQALHSKAHGWPPGGRALGGQPWVSGPTFPERCRRSIPSAGIAFLIDWCHRPCSSSGNGTPTAFGASCAPVPRVALRGCASVANPGLRNVTPAALYPGASRPPGAMRTVMSSRPSWIAPETQANHQGSHNVGVDISAAEPSRLGMTCRHLALRNRSHKRSTHT